MHAWVQTSFSDVTYESSCEQFIGSTGRATYVFGWCQAYEEFPNRGDPRGPRVVRRTNESKSWDQGRRAEPDLSLCWPASGIMIPDQRLWTLSADEQEMVPFMELSQLISDYSGERAHDVSVRDKLVLPVKWAVGRLDDWAQSIPTWASKVYI